MMVGVHHNQILLIEQGKSNPSLQTLLRIANGLDVPLSDLLPDRRGEADKRSYWFSRYGNHSASEIDGPVFGAIDSLEHGSGSEGENSNDAPYSDPLLESTARTSGAPEYRRAAR